MALVGMAWVFASALLEEPEFCSGGWMDEKSLSPLMLGAKSTASGRKEQVCFLLHFHSLSCLPRGLVRPCRAVLGSLTWLWTFE